MVCLALSITACNKEAPKDTQAETKASGETKAETEGISGDAKVVKFWSFHAGAEAEFLEMVWKSIIWL